MKFKTSVIFKIIVTLALICAAEGSFSKTPVQLKHPGWEMANFGG